MGPHPAPVPGKKVQPMEFIGYIIIFVVLPVMAFVGAVATAAAQHRRDIGASYERWDKERRVARAAAQHRRNIVVGATLLGGLIGAFVGGGGGLVWLARGDELHVAFAPYEMGLFGLWGAPVGAWLGFGIGKEITGRQPRDLPEDREG